MVDYLDSKVAKDVTKALFDAKVIDIVQFLKSE